MTSGADNSRIVIIGPPRAGTTLLASLLAQLGIDFGLETRSWNVNSGYYEHPDLLRIYGQIRKYNRLSHVSDNLAERFRHSAVRSLAQLLSQVQAVKYPPVSAQLPYLMERAGYAPVLAISARRFEPYAISRMRMEGIGYQACKQDYLEIYQTAILMQRIYKAVVIDYEALTGTQQGSAETTLSLLTETDTKLVREVLKSSVKQARSQSKGLRPDKECEALYEQLIS